MNVDTLIYMLSPLVPKGKFIDLCHEHTTARGYGPWSCEALHHPAIYEMQVSGEAQRAPIRAPGWTNTNENNHNNNNNIVHSSRRGRRQDLGVCNLCLVPLTRVSVPRRHDSIFRLDCTRCIYKVCIHCITQKYLDEGLIRFISANGAEITEAGYENGNVCRVECPFCRKKTHTSPLWHLPFCGRAGTVSLLAKINGENMEGANDVKKEEWRRVIEAYSAFMTPSDRWQRLNGGSDVGNRIHGCVFPSSSGAPYELNNAWSKHRILTYEECQVYRAQARAQPRPIPDSEVVERVDVEEVASEEHGTDPPEEVEENVLVEEAALNDVDPPSEEVEVEVLVHEVVLNDEATTESQVVVRSNSLDVESVNSPDVLREGNQQNHTPLPEPSELIVFGLASLSIVPSGGSEEDDLSVSSSTMSVMENGGVRREVVAPCSTRMRPAVGLISQGMYHSGIVDNSVRFEINHLLIQLVLSIPTYFWLPFSLMAVLPFICYIVARAIRFYGEWQAVTHSHDVSHIPGRGEGDPDPSETKEILMYTRYSHLTTCWTIISRWLIANFSVYVMVIMYRVYTYDYQSEFSYDYPFLFITMSNVMLLITVCRHSMMARRRYAGILQYSSKYLFGFPVVLTDLYSIPGYEGVVSAPVYINSLRTIFARVRAGNLDHDALQRYISGDLGREVGPQVDPVVLENSVAALRQWIIIRNLIHPPSDKGGVSNVNY